MVNGSESKNDHLRESGLGSGGGSGYNRWAWLGGGVLRSEVFDTICAVGMFMTGVDRESAYM